MLNPFEERVLKWLKRVHLLVVALLVIMSADLLMMTYNTSVVTQVLRAVHKLP
jgi:hypothetical protein